MSALLGKQSPLSGALTGGCDWNSQPLRARKSTEANSDQNQDQMIFLAGTKFGIVVATRRKPLRINGRGDRIRTCDIYVPNVALYQSELRPVREPVGQAPGRAVYDYKTDSSTRSASGLSSTDRSNGGGVFGRTVDLRRMGEGALKEQRRLGGRHRPADPLPLALLAATQGQ